MTPFDLHVVEDSFAVLARLEPDEVDVTITDPPYNEHVQSNMISGTAMKAHVAGGSGAIPHKELPFDPLTSYTFARDLVRATKRWVLVFSAVEDFGAYKSAVRVNAGKKSAVHWVRGGIWYKPNAQGQMTGDRPAAAYEGIAIMHSATKKVWNGRGSYAYWRAEDDSSHYMCSGTRGEGKATKTSPNPTPRHPNQKPLRLCLELVAKFSTRGETVFDPFCGSGRIGEACMLLGRKYFGLDSDPVWIAATRRRLTRALRDGWGVLSDAECLHLCSAERASSLPPLPAPALAIAVG